MQKLEIYYDGLCRLCSAEIEHYRGCKHKGNLLFTDITKPSFRAEAAGLDPKKVHVHLHARSSDGTLFLGVDAFIEIWKRIPEYQWAAKIAKITPVRLILKMGYAGFVRIRPLLPKKKQQCSDSPYCEFEGAKR